MLIERQIGRERLQPPMLVFDHRQLEPTDRLVAQRWGRLEVPPGPWLNGAEAISAEELEAWSAWAPVPAARIDPVLSSAYKRDRWNLRTDAPSSALRYEARDILVIGGRRASIR